jgi:hypothetical protein
MNSALNADDRSWPDTVHLARLSIANAIVRRSALGAKAGSRTAQPPSEARASLTPPSTATESNSDGVRGRRVIHNHREPAQTRGCEVGFFDWKSALREAFASRIRATIFINGCRGMGRKGRNRIAGDVAPAPRECADATRRQPDRAWVIIYRPVGISSLAARIAAVRAATIRVPRR